MRHCYSSLQFIYNFKTRTEQKTAKARTLCVYLNLIKIDTVVRGRIDPRVRRGRVGSVLIFRNLAGRVGSGQHFGFFSFLLISYFLVLNRYESSNSTFELIDLL